MICIAFFEDISQLVWRISRPYLSLSEILDIIDSFHLKTIAHASIRKRLRALKAKVLWWKFRDEVSFEATSTTYDAAHLRLPW